jgi:myo-inositol-1-phosphate synthase
VSGRESTLEIVPAQGSLAFCWSAPAPSAPFIAGVFAVRKGLAKPIGSLTQMGTVRLGRGRTTGPRWSRTSFPRQPDDLVFGGWDIFEDNC